MAEAARFFNWRGLQSVGKGNLIEMLLFVDICLFGRESAHMHLLILIQQGPEYPLDVCDNGLILCNIDQGFVCGGVETVCSLGCH